MQRDFSVSMTPMIDVVFLLLIFFVCTASFQIPESILPSPLEYPGTTSADLPPELAEPEPERVLIAITQRDNKIQLTINGQNCPSLAKLSSLLVALASVDVTLPLWLDIAEETSLGTAVDVYDRCRLAGFERVQFIVEAQ